MEKEQPQPDEPAPDHTDHTAATPKRLRSDSESSLSSQSIQSTRSLRSEDLEFVHENGRVYGNESYYMPCDQLEQDRLALQHQVFVLALKGKLTTTLTTPNTRRILDLGTGPGYWAVAMARQYPHAEVVGVDMAVWDLETTEAVSGGAHVTWELDDLDVWGVEPDVDEIATRMEQYDPFRDHANRQPQESPTKIKTKSTESQPLTPSELSINPYDLDSELQPGWHFSEAFDLIHLRGMKGSFAYWEDAYAEIYRNLAPGGWVEIADYDIVIPDSLKLKNTTIDPMPTFRKLYVSMMQASFKSGRPLGTFYLHPTYLEEAGFTNITTTYVNVPIGQWPQDEEQKKIGKLFYVVFMENSEATLLRLLTKFGDKDRVWPREEVMAAVEEAKREIFTWSERAERGEVEGWCASFKWVIGRKSKNT